MYVNGWVSYECSDEGTCTSNIPNSSTHSHPSEQENLKRASSNAGSIRDDWTSGENT